MDKSKKDFSFNKRAVKYDDGFEGKFSQRFYNILLQHIELESGIAASHRKGLAQLIILKKIK